MKKYKVELIETYAFYFEVEANNRVEAEEKAKEYVDKYQADKFFECSTNRVFKIIPSLLPNTIENLQKCGFLAFRGLINMEIVKEYQQKNF